MFIFYYSKFNSYHLVKNTIRCFASYSKNENRKVFKIYRYVGMMDGKLYLTYNFYYKENTS